MRKPCKFVEPMHNGYSGYVKYGRPVVFMQIVNQSFLSLNNELYSI